MKSSVQPFPCRSSTEHQLRISPISAARLSASPFSLRFRITLTWGALSTVSGLFVMNVYVVLSYLLFLFGVGSSMRGSLGVSCREHPAHLEGLKPVLIQSWEILSGTRTLPGMYHVGHDTHRYAPIDNPDAMQFDRLDWFWVVQHGPTRGKYVKLILTRPAKVYILVPFNARRTGRNPSLPGWATEGIVKLVTGMGKPLRYGIYQTSTRPVIDKMYIFSKSTTGEILLPNTKWVQKFSRGIHVTADWTLMLAEEDGSAPILQYPPNPPGVDQSIKPNERCPDSLHNLWVTRSTDENDENTKGIKWKTWHPQWDPCFWCGYDHEHGSSPKHLMGYEPKFHYAAWKNGRENESHEGYKGFVFRYETYFIYFMVHLQTSNLRRVSVRHHTVLLAVTDARTKELMMEVTHKADFGFIGVKLRSGRLLPLSKNERRIHDAQMHEGSIRNMRSINVIDFGKLNRYYLYITPRRRIRRGVYETWTTVPLCSANNRLGVVQFDVTSSATGIKTRTTHKVKAVLLGYKKSKTLYRQTGAPRLIRLSGFSAGDSYCSFKLKNVHGRLHPDGSFYTDPYGVALYNGPSERTIRQYVKPGFNMKVSGKFGAVESWTGLYKRNVFGSIINYGFSIDPDKN